MFNEFSFEASRANGVMSQLSELSETYNLPLDYGQIFHTALIDYVTAARSVWIHKDPKFIQFMHDFVISYEVMIRQLVNEGTPQAIQFLFSSPKHPNEVQLTGVHGLTAIQAFSAMHQERNRNMAIQVRDSVIARPCSTYITGPMHSAKSDLAIKTIDLIKADGYPVHTTIFEGMGETKVSTRLGRSIDAVPVSLTGLRDQIDTMSGMYADRPGDVKAVLVVEEATFMGWGYWQKYYLKILTEHAHAHGISLLFLGLDSDFLAYELPFSEAIDDLVKTSGGQRFNCQSYRLEYLGEELEIQPARNTIRYTAAPDQPGPINFGFPIVVPRALGLFIYEPVEHEYHAQNILNRAGRPDLYRSLTSYKNESLLEAYWVKKQEYSATLSQAA
jgi:thymidine kinase